MKKFIVIAVLLTLLAAPFAFAQDAAPTEPAPAPSEPTPPPSEPAPVQEPSVEPAPSEPTPTPSEPSPVRPPSEIFPQPSPCPSVSPSCSRDTRPEAVFGDNGCIVSYNCVGFSQPLPQPQPSQCQNVVACVSGDGCCAPGCSGDNDNDCGVQEKPIYNPRPPQNLPPDCHFESTQFGEERVVCNAKPVCPSPDETKRQGDKCAATGGTPVSRDDPNGCSFIDCQFQQSQRGFFDSYEKCQTKDDVEQVVQKCKSQGLAVNFVREGGCNNPVCRQEEDRQACPGPEEWKRVSQSCTEQGLGVVKLIDQNGCNKPICGDKPAAEVPEETYLGCEKKGGEVVIRRDNSGEIKFMDCIRKGNNRDVVVGGVGEMPETTTLLSMALRLEDVKIQLDQLSQKTKDIALYWEGRSGTEAQTSANRMNRVSGMFSSAKSKIEDIKKLVQDVARSEDANKMLEVRHEFEYLKNVMLKDILFYMLSSDSSAEDFVVEGGCGTDGGCFDDAYRACKQTTFQPEQGISVEIKGLEATDCILSVQSSEGSEFGQSMSMTCKVPTYAEGMSGPEDIIKFCEGPMADMINKFGFDEEGRTGPSVPGKCTGDGCRSYCGKSAETAQECLDNLGPYLPAEAKEGLTRLASGQGFGFGSGPSQEPVRDQRQEGFNDDFRDEFNDDFRRGEEFGNEFNNEFNQPGAGLCGDGICDDFEQSHPGECIRDCPYQAEPGGSPSFERLPQETVASTQPAVQVEPVETSPSGDTSSTPSASGGGGGSSGTNA